MKHVFLFFLVSLGSPVLLAQMKGLNYDTPYYLRTIANRGYINRYNEDFVISNGLRTQYVFERAGDSDDEMFIKVLPAGDYLTAYSDGHVGSEKHQESRGRFKVKHAAIGFSFQSANGRYLMADFDTGLLSLSPGQVASTWEDFTLERVFDERGFDENGFNSKGIHQRTQTLVDERGFNSRGFNKYGLPDFDKAAQNHNNSFFLWEQKRNLHMIHDEPTLPALQTPNIYLIIIDTMREDFVNPETGPNLLAFKNQSVHTDIALSGSTTTHPSLYSLFHSRPSYELYAYAASGVGMGPLPLNILKYQAGYSIKATGKKDMGCLDVDPPPYFPISQVSFMPAMEFRFGLKTYLLDDCVTKGFIGNETLYKDRLVNLDKNVLGHFVDLAEKSSKERTLIIAHLEGAHTPYLFKNEDKHVAEKYPYESQRNYGRAFHKTDRWFGEFISELKKRGLYDNALIVVLGDHGEELFPPPADSGDHGAYPVDFDQTRIPLYFKFPKDDMKDVPLTKVSTLADVFPTIFDYLGIWVGFEHYFTGRPITDLRTHVVPISRVNPDNEISFFAYPYKLNTKYRPQDYVGPSSLEDIEQVQASDFQVGDLEDFYDRTINPSAKSQISSKELANFDHIFPFLFKKSKTYPYNQSCGELRDSDNAYPIDARLDFTIRNKNLCLTSSSKDDGGKISLTPCNGTDHQRFDRILLSDGSSQIRSKSSCKCLDIEYQSKKEEAGIHQWTCHVGPSQHFALTLIEGSWLEWIKSTYSGLCVENTKTGLIQKRCAKNHASQQFHIDYVQGIFQ